MLLGSLLSPLTTGTPWSHICLHHPCVMMAAPAPPTSGSWSRLIMGARSIPTPAHLVPYHDDDNWWSRKLSFIQFISSFLLFASAQLFSPSYKSSGLRSMVLRNQDNVPFPVSSESVSICQLYFVITMCVTGIRYNGPALAPTSVTIYLDLLSLSTLTSSS